MRRSRFVFLAAFLALVLVPLGGVHGLSGPSPAYAASPGVDTPGVVRLANWFLSDSFGGSGDHNFVFGNSGDLAVVGDWNGDGVDTPGVLRGSTWYLSDTFNATVDYSFVYGQPGDLPVVGDWNGDGRDTVGVFRGDTWYLSDALGGAANYTFAYGVAGDRPVVGDWNGDGRDSPGVVRDANWFLSDSFGGNGDHNFAYGNPGDLVVAGDWNNDGIDTPGVVRNASWFLSDSFGGNGDHNFGYGNPGDLVVAGHWSGAAPPPPPPPPPPANEVTVTPGNGYYTFTNSFGSYRIYYQCSPADHVGPGYIAQWQTPTGTYLLNEPGAAGSRYDDASGGSATTLGLGKFVFRDFRKGNGVLSPSTPTEGTIAGGVYTSPPNSWPITGAMCASNNTYNAALNNAYDPAEIVGGRGVTGVAIDQAPTSVLSGTAIQFGLTVTFGDYYNADILRVRYLWRFYNNQVKMWTRLAIDCSSQPCMTASGNNNEYLYVKGPKFVAGINGSPSSSTAGFTRLVDFRSAVSTPTIATNLSGGLCMYNSTNPQVVTNKCSDNDRTRVRFDFGNATSGINGGCAATTTPCLNAIFRAYGNNNNGLTLTPDFASHPWEGSGFGLDQWALAAANLPAAVPGDNAGCTGSGTSPTDQGARQWELIGYKNAAGVYEAAASAYFAWLDCTVVSSGGAFYRPVPLNSSWGTYANFAFNSNWTTSYS